MAATTTTLQIGTYTPLTDSFALTLDLNDRATFFVQDVQLPQPPKVFVESSNVRVPGVAVQKFQYKNREITAQLFIYAANTQAIQSAIHTLISAIEQPPYVLRVQLAGGLQFTHFTVLEVQHSEPYNALRYLQGVATGITIKFTCRPFGFTIPRQTLHNLASNPGFEAPMGGTSPAASIAPTAFSDSFANANAYAVQAGSALISDFSGLPTTVLADAPVRYHRFNESGGSVAIDGSRFGQHANLFGSIGYSTTGLLTGDTDTAFTLDGATTSVIEPTSGLATGANPWTMSGFVKYAGTPSGNQIVMWNGKNVASQGVYLQVDNTRTPTLAVFGGTATAGTAGSVTLNTVHQLSMTYDGTTLRGYLDGVQFAAITVTLNITFGQVAFGAGFFTGSVGNWCACVLDEAMVFTSAISAARLLAYYTTATTSPSSIANAYRIPAGTRVSFGSPAWGAFNTWQVRWRWMPNALPIFYLHYTDANNYLAALITQGSLALVQTVAGTQHTLASTSLSSGSYLQFATNYWLQMTQYPAVRGYLPQVQATVLSDSAGAVGTSLMTVGPVATYDGATALSGAPQITTSGAPLPIGGNFANVHKLTLFGPGGWTFQNTGASLALGAWEQNANNTATLSLANGAGQTQVPVTSYAAARIDAPPSGAWSALWRLFAGGTPAGTSAIPAAQGQVFGFSVAYSASGGSGSAQQQLLVCEYDASGTALSAATVLASHTGNTAGWTTFSGLTYTVVSASCAYLDVQCLASDTGSGGTVWFDNVQVWNITTSGMAAMPYCETTFPNSPAQIVVSGLIGDAVAPAYVAAGTYQASFAPGTALTLNLGRVAAGKATAQWIAFAATQLFGGTPQLDTNAYGGLAKVAAAAVIQDVLALMQRPADATGLFHLLGRAQTAQTTLSQVSARVRGYQGTAPNGDAAEYYGPYIQAFTATNRWQLVDAGLCPLPYFPLGAFADPTQTFNDPVIEFQDTNGSPAAMKFNWTALLPIDGSLLIATLNNPGNSGTTPATSWEFMYVDGAGLWTPSAAWGASYSVESTPLPNPGHGAGGTVSQSAGPINLFLAAEPYLTLDPTNQLGGLLGTNQLLGVVTDTAGDVLPLATEFKYSPQWLFPR